MQPLVDWPLANRRQPIGVFTDIDDTLPTQGGIAPWPVDAELARAILQAPP